MKGKPPQFRSPQAKKALSYCKDMRNAFGENDKASRKAIPKRKAEEHRRVRRETKQLLDGIRCLDEDVAGVVESSVRHDIASTGGWRKTSDVPLSAHLRRQEFWRAYREGRKLNPQAERHGKTRKPD